MATDRERIAAIERDTISIKEKLETFVTVDRYKPVERLVFGIVALALTGIVAAGLGSLFKMSAAQNAHAEEPPFAGMP